MFGHCLLIFCWSLAHVCSWVFKYLQFRSRNFKCNQFISIPGWQLCDFTVQLFTSQQVCVMDAEACIHRAVMGDALGEVELREVPCSSARWGWECWEGAVWIYFWPFLPMLIFMLVSWGTPLEARGSYGPEIQHAMSKCKLCSPIPTPTHTSWCYHIYCFRVKDLLRSTPHRSHPSWQKFDQIWPVGNGWLQVARGGRLGWCKVADRSRIEAYRSCRFCKLL